MIGYHHVDIDNIYQTLDEALFFDHHECCYRCEVQHCVQELAGKVDTGGEGALTQWVHGELMVSSEAIRPPNTHWVNAPSPTVSHGTMSGQRARRGHCSPYTRPVVK